MERCGDFMQWLLPDMSIKILMCLEDPSDLVRVSAVSSSWRQFAYFQFGFPIYSAKAVRFRVGHPNVKIDVESDDRHESAAAQGSLLDKIIWTYTSPAFPMAQENSLQKFKLPEPVLCIGGVLQVELLGRVQRQELDGQYYICVSHVQVVGRPLLPAFDVEILDESGKWNLKYYPKENSCQSRTKFSVGESSSTRLRSFGSNLRGWEQMILDTLLGAGAVVVDDDSDEEYDV